MGESIGVIQRKGLPASSIKTSNFALALYVNDLMASVQVVRFRGYVIFTCEKSTPLAVNAWRSIRIGTLMTPAAASSTSSSGSSSSSTVLNWNSSGHVSGTLLSRGQPTGQNLPFSSSG